MHKIINTYFIYILQENNASIELNGIKVQS